MPYLMIYQPAPDETDIAARTGGRPLAPAGTEWPTCESCQGAMQFLAQLPIDRDGLLLVFMCQNDPGLCDEWDADSGGNKAMVVSREALQLLSPPSSGVVALPEISGMALSPMEGAYETARSAWPQQRDVLGQWGGEPHWIQGDETPRCPQCQASMGFVASLEEGHDYDTSANFGGGVGYVFACEACFGPAKFLWQQ